MPNFKTQPPAWGDFAHILIERLRCHHGVASNTNDVGDTPSELDILFEKFEAGKDVERFGRVGQTHHAMFRRGRC